MFWSEGTASSWGNTRVQTSQTVFIRKRDRSKELRGKTDKAEEKLQEDSTAILFYSCAIKADALWEQGMRCADT